MRRHVPVTIFSAAIAIALGTLPAEAAPSALLSANALKATTEYKELASFAKKPADDASSTITIIKPTGSSTWTRTGPKTSPARMSTNNKSVDDGVVVAITIKGKDLACVRPVTKSLPADPSADAGAVWTCNEDVALTYGFAQFPFVASLTLFGSVADFVSDSSTEPKFTIEKVSSEEYVVTAKESATSTWAVRYTRTSTGFRAISAEGSKDQVTVVVDVPASEQVLPWTSLRKAAPKPVMKTIACVKGKKLRKVTAVNPKCPAGYRKK